MKIMKSLLIGIVIGLSIASYWAHAAVSGLCDCQYVACAPDASEPVHKLCLWMSKHQTIEVVAVSAPTVEEVAPKCKELEEKYDFLNIPGLDYDIRGAIFSRQGTVICEEIRF